ncbi:MAG: YbaB/EbfC family nucleoid-associated protein [Dehalococcoidia bacterium]|jgi:DNA-binding YbaB/EbfC family protein|nr:YbaB/EbfC family nucleoid-associated protein [Dehalococcoidia bacterium]PCJ73194.1 MAG: YbaB/EbfC family nucleoid-associated protein [Dehalococcoidia bacterium]PKB81820.1 MAG: YbaB/EbfC family nucleoid-associated protein [SAR202 cluster bacterium MP-SInd-SRR3963457-G1]PKB84390.1 MAG: YbaB/EbfC family nucleoid-associated protein [SAR202 cluster bacterium MP-NPac-SRR3961935-G1]RUA31186.1 MAG: YbaB/EbfC family nucleoid-associated protein [Chloroflexota bacterium]|tara:strand:- start:1928 stop:2224 length:297 start_codon:yes stop_codon:yes gene_type:complete
MNRNMMRQAQKQLAQLQKIQEELETMTVEGSAGGGAVKVVMTGKQIVESVTIEPEAAEEVDLLQDMVLAAVNDASTKAQELAAQKMSVVTAGMNIPGL